jgi:hypothetical protein
VPAPLHGSSARPGGCRREKKKHQRRATVSATIATLVSTTTDLLAALFGWVKGASERPCSSAALGVLIASSSPPGRKATMESLLLRVLKHPTLRSPVAACIKHNSGDFFFSNRN